jgi:hypothetical protein
MGDKRDDLIFRASISLRSSVRRGLWTSMKDDGLFKVQLTMKKRCGASIIWGMQVEMWPHLTSL